MNQIVPPETSDSGRPRAAGVGYQIATRTAAVAGVFSLIVCAVLLYDYSLREAQDPFESEAWKVVKLALTQQPDNEELKQEARTCDLQLRRRFFHRRAFTAVGAWLLLGGVVVFLIAARSAATLRRRLPTPGPEATPQDVETQMTRVARWSVGVLAVALIGMALALALGIRSELPQSQDELAALLRGSGRQQPAGTDAKRWSAAELPPPPSAGQIRQMWPRFRGPGGLGMSAYTNLPDSWDDSSGENILWKEPVPLPGFNSPVVWADRVFLSGANKDRREVYCFDANTGKLLWQKNVPGTPQSTAEMPDREFAGYAAPTAVTDGRWVFAIFANGDVAAFDFDGNLAWARSLGIPENSYGHASSLTMFRNLLLVQFDQAGRKDGKSKLLALDVTNKGETAWQADREVPSSWPSPIVIRHAGRDQIITSADPWVIAYDPAEGAEIWRAKCLRQDVGPSPTFAAGVVYVVSEFPYLSAIRADGEGDVTESHVLWTAEDGLPDTSSPLATDEYVFLLASYGTLTCYDAKRGELLWEEDFDANFSSSPSLVGKRVYLFGEVEEQDGGGDWVEKSKAWVVQPDRNGCKIISQSNLEEGCVTSPAFQDGRIYIRGKKHLFCIGRP